MAHERRKYVWLVSEQNATVMQSCWPAKVVAAAAAAAVRSLSLNPPTQYSPKLANENELAAAAADAAHDLIGKMAAATTATAN